MIDALEIAGYQSLRKARIELGALTVIEGPSNSGKSALVRALVMLARNARGTAYISTGMTTCTVTAGSADEGWVLRLTRSTARGKDAYRLRILQGGVAGARAPAAAEFTKLQGGVPDEASELLRLGDLNIARQPDPPFLLTESGRDVAAVLGRLTNVSMVLAAAAEAGRRRKQAARDLKGADARLAELREQAQEFAGLGDRRRAIGRAEAALETAQGLAAQLEQLRGLVSRVAESGDQARQARAAAQAAEPPSTAALDELLARRDRLAALLDEHADAAREVTVDIVLARGAEQAEAGAHKALHGALVAAGTCPTCGQPVT
jgi:DNA repair ATPase RecN